MELKKTRKVDLERRKPTFFQIGLLLSLLIVFIAFELIGTRDEKKVSYVGESLPMDDDVVLPTDPKNEVKPQMRTAPPTAIIDVIKGSRVELPDIVIDAGDDPSVGYGNDGGIIDIPPPPEPTFVEIPIIEFPEILPEFKGGDAARQKFLRDNTVYPPKAMELGIAGTVILSLVVEPDGSISNVKVVRGVHSSLDEEAVRVTKSMPKWNPGKQAGRVVRVRYTMPIKFLLED